MEKPHYKGTLKCIYVILGQETKSGVWSLQAGLCIGILIILEPLKCIFSGTFEKKKVMPRN